MDSKKFLDLKDALEKLDSVTHIRRGAPIVLLFSYDSDEDWKNPYEEGIHSGIQDVSIVATHIMMEAADLGLGSTWVGSFDPVRLKAVVPELEGWTPIALFPVGHPAGEPSPRHGERKSLEEFVTMIV